MLAEIVRVSYLCCTKPAKKPIGGETILLEKRGRFDELIITCYFAFSKACYVFTRIFYLRMTVFWTILIGIVINDPLMYNSMMDCVRLICRETFFHEHYYTKNSKVNLRVLCLTCI